MTRATAHRLRAGAEQGVTLWLRRLARHERAVTALLLGAAVLAGLSALRPAESRMSVVVAAAHALPGGDVLTSHDLLTVRVPAEAVPDGAFTALDAAIGLVVAAPMSRGELLTQTRVVGTALLGAVRPGAVATPVRIADAATATLLRAGDHVDLLGTPRDGGAAVVVAADVPVLAVPASSSGLDDGALVLVACTPAVAQALAEAAVSSRISVVLRGH